MRTVAVFTLLTLGAANAVAQPMTPQGPTQRPTVSPYINLLNNNRNGGIGGNALQSYYGIVRPEQNLRQQNSMLQQQLSNTNQNLNAFQQTVASADGTNPLITGKGATFNNTSHYFNNINGGGGGGFGGGMSSGFSNRGGNSTMGNIAGNRNVGQAPQGTGGRSRR